MAATKISTNKIVRAISSDKRTIAYGLILSLSITLLGGTFAHADNNVIFGQNNPALGGILGGVSGLVQSTVSNGNQAVGAVAGHAQGLAGPVSAVGNAVSGRGGALPVQALNGAMNGLGNGITGIGPAVGGVLPAFNNGIGAAGNSTQSILNTAPGSNIGSNALPLLPNGMAEPQQNAPIFNAATVQSVRGLNLIASSSLIGMPLQPQEPRQFTVPSNNAVLNELGSGRMQLKAGSVLLSLPSARNSVLMETPVGRLWVGRQSNVLINLTNGILQIQNLDSVGQNVRFQMAGSQQVVSVRPGYELLASNGPLQLAALRPTDGVGRRAQITMDSNRMAVSEINLTSLIKNQPLLSGLQSSSNAADRKVFDRLVKTAAILDMTRGRGGFVAAGNRSTVTEIAGQGIGTASRIVNNLVSTAGQTAGNVLGALPNGEIPPVPNLPGQGTGDGGGNGGNSDGSGIDGTGGSTGAAELSQAVQVANANTNTNSNIASQTSASSAAIQSIVPTDQTRVNAPKANSRFAAIEPEQRKKTQAKGLYGGEYKLANPSYDQSPQDTQESEKSSDIYGPFLPISQRVDENKNATAYKQADYENPPAESLQTSDNNSHSPISHALGSAKGTIRRFPEIFLALGLVIGALMILSLALARAAFLRARELEAMNARLAGEISERKQLEQHATKLNEDLEQRLEELAHLNQDLQSARDQAVEGSRLKSEFVANISHEIRTPISAVIGMNQLLLNTKLDDKQKDYARLVNDSAQSLLTVINDILDFSKIEAGKLEVNSVAFSLDTVMKEVRDMLASSAQSKRLKLFTFIDPEVSNDFRGDPARLRQILINLAGNAVKFTAEGEVVIHVTRVAKEEGAEKVKFAVQDSGIGISPEAQAKLFQPFVQADGSTTRRYGGTGLGLSISKRLVELLGGEIHVESSEGKGSTFWFELPAWAGIVGDATRMDGAHPSNKRILILSPQPYSPEILGKHLTKVGLDAELLRSGEETAIKSTLASSPFSAILVDSLHGQALSNVFDANPELANTPVAFLRDSDAVKSPKNLQAAPLTTPLNQNDLLRCMVSLSCGDAEKATSLDNKPDTDATSTETVFANTRILVAEDSVVLQRMVKSLLEKLGCSVEIVGNGKQAVAAASSNSYNMIFMDWQMPEMDGLEATQKIRNFETVSGKHIPIIAMTANAMQGDKDTCLSAGMDGYMSKPFKLDDLRNIISQYASQATSS